MNPYKENIENNYDNSAYLVDDNSNFTREEVIEKCSSIFYNFSKCDKKDKIFYINSTNIKKIFKIVNLIDDKSLKSSDIDILIKKINPNINKLTEKNFLDLLVLISARIYPKDYKKNAKSTFDNLISTFFEPFSKHIDDKNVNLNDALKMPYMHKSLEILIDNFIIDYRLISLVNNIFFAVKEIYKNYFNLENQSMKETQKIISNSQNNLIDFCKDFQILPFMISQEQLIIYFNLIIKVDINNLTNVMYDEEENGNKNENFIIDPKKDMGKIFTLSRFCVSLIHFSIFSYSKNNQMNLNNINDCEKFLLFLEKLENSKGFKNFEKKSNKPHTTNFSLIPKKSVLKMIESDLLDAYDYFSDEDNSIKDKENPNNLNNNFGKSLQNANTTYLNQTKRLISTEKFLKEYDELIKKNKEIEIKYLLNLNEENYEALIGSNMDFLKEIFSYYAKIGDKFNPIKLTYSSYVKFFKDCNLIMREKERENHFTNIKNTDDYNSRIISKTPSKGVKDTVINSLSKSPITKNRTSMKKENSSIKKTNKNIEEERKLRESDINVIYSNLMGNKKIELNGIF